MTGSIATGIAVLLLAIVALFLWLRTGRRSSSSSANLENVTIDVSSLASHGPSTSGDHLVLFGVPVRLVVLVMAPSGREGGDLSKNELPGLVNHIVPGLLDVVAADQPLFRRWPPQLSSQGFMHSFFGNMALPGRRGVGTPWCSVAGRFETTDRTFLVGIVLCAREPNSMSETTVEQPGRWLEVLRVQKGN